MIVWLYGRVREAIKGKWRAYLYARYSAKDENGAIQDSKSAFDFDGEIDVTLGDLIRDGEERKEEVLAIPGVSMMLIE